MAIIQGGEIESPEIVGINIEEDLTSQVDGLNQVFVISQEYKNLRVYQNGLLMVSPDDYTETSTIDFTLSFIPPLLSTVVVVYDKAT